MAALALVDARTMALKVRGEAAVGRDPCCEKRQAKVKARRDRATEPQAVTALLKVYEREVLPRKRPSTIAYQTVLWDGYIKPRLGDCELVALDRATARAALKEIGETARVTANRAHALLLRAFGDDDHRQWRGAAFPNARAEGARPMTRHALTRAMTRILAITNFGALRSRKSARRVTTFGEISPLVVCIRECPLAGWIQTLAKTAMRRALAHSGLFAVGIFGRTQQRCQP